MFILRRISGRGVQMNLNLGSSYTYIGKNENPEEFERTLKEVFDNLNEEIIYAFVSDEDGKHIYPLYKGQKAYIMTESGKTFDNVSE
jgi:hypothetical protein